MAYKIKSILLLCLIVLVLTACQLPQAPQTDAVTPDGKIILVDWAEHLHNNLSVIADVTNEIYYLDNESIRLTNDQYLKVVFTEKLYEEKYIIVKWSNSSNDEPLLHLYNSNLQLLHTGVATNTSIDNHINYELDPGAEEYAFYLKVDGANPDSFVDIDLFMDPDTGVKSASSTGSPNNQFSNPTNAYVSDNIYAIENRNNQKQDYGTFNFGIPATSTILGIEVLVEGDDPTFANQGFSVELSWDGGTTYTSAGYSATWPTGTDVTRYLGGAADTWGRTWADTEFSTSNFRVRMNKIGNDYSNTKLDWIGVNVTYTSSGPFKLSNISAENITYKSANIVWESSNTANSTVDYGTTTALGSTTHIEDSVYSHSVPLTGLTNGTLYFYNVTSCDSGGTCATNGTFNFTTGQAFVNFTYLISQDSTSIFPVTSGTFANTLWNAEPGNERLLLNKTFGLGNYTSEVFDAGILSTWNTISWFSDQAYGTHLPANKGTDDTAYYKYSADMTNNTVNYYFNESSGNIIDYSGESNTMTATNLQYGVTFPNIHNIYNNGTVWFNGVNAQTSIASSTANQMTGNTTIMFNLYLNETPNNWGVYAQKGSNYKFFKPSTAGVLRWSLNGYGDLSTPSGTLSAPGFYNVIFTLVDTAGGNDLRKIYVNGVEKASWGPSFGTLSPSTAPLTMGYDGTTNYQKFGMSDYSMWKRVLSLQEISDLYTRAVAKAHVEFRSCDDPACSGETWNSIHYYQPPININQPDNRYFQYFTELHSNDTINNITPEIFSFNITRTSAVGVVENVTLYTLTGTNTTDDDLLLNFSVNGPQYTNITDYRIENNSIALLNIPFEADGVNNSRDYSSYNHTTYLRNIGTFKNESYGIGKYGNAYTYTNLLPDHVHIPYAADLYPENYTISLWVNSTSTDASEQFLFGKNDVSGVLDIALFIESDNKVWCGQGVSFGTYTAAVSTTTIANTGVWHHIACSYNGTDYLIYIDGVQEDTQIATRPVDNGCDYQIGSVGFNCNDGNNDGLRFNGQIDQFQYFNRSLSIDQIQDLAIPDYSIIVSNETATGENWTACVTPNNNITDGTTQCSNVLQIEPAITDTCTPSCSSGYWQLDCSDNCVYTTPTNIDCSVNATGLGVISIQNKWNFTQPASQIDVAPMCQLDVYSGGSIN